MLFKYHILILLLTGMSICGVAPVKQVAPAGRTSSGEKKIKMAITPLNFDTDIKPIFEKRCNPCHFPGGKLYDRLPFDQASTIIKNEKRILGRIKDTAEVKMIQQFVDQNSTANSGTANQ